MTLCLRICGAYSYRLTRRHSTVLLLASLIVSVTLLFQLYSYRQKSQRYHQQLIGEFDYHPGAFLKGRYPSNQSYCEFQYGFPDKIDWQKIPIDTPPETGAKSHQRVIYNAIKGTAYANYTKFNAVTYATHATPEFIYHVLEIARYWEGPISLAVYVPSYDFALTMQVMNHLCHCYKGMAKVSLHLIYPLRHPPKLSVYEEIVSSPVPSTTTESYEQNIARKAAKYRSLNNKTRAEYINAVRAKKAKKMMMGFQKVIKKAPRLKFTDCSGVEEFKDKTYRSDHAMIYPINVARNVARNASKTNYFIVSDIEMVPSDGLAPKFLKMVRQLMGDKKREEGCIFSKTVFVVPLFEVERGEEIPRDKATLVRQIAANRAMYFHQKICSHCQRFPGLQSWLSRPAPTELEPMLIGRREYPYHRWEPLYFGTQREPWYSEQLSWEGRQDKMTQMLELCLQEYRMVVLDGGFLSHAAVTRMGTRDNRAERINARRYLRIIADLRHKYKDRPQCKVK